MTGRTYTFRTATTAIARCSAALGRGLPLALPVGLRTVSRPTWWGLPKMQLRARTVLRLASHTSFLVAAASAADHAPVLTYCHVTCSGEAPSSLRRWSGLLGGGPSASPSRAGAVCTVRGCAAEVLRGLSARLPSSFLLLSVLSIFRARTDEEMPAAGGVR